MATPPLRFGVIDDMRADTSFLYRLADLRGRCRPEVNPYDQLKISGDLRILLLDGLHCEVNRTYRIPITFPVNICCVRRLIRKRQNSFCAGLFEGLILDYSHPHRLQVQRLNLQRFLQQTVMIAVGRRASVKELIRFCANLEGGIHHDEPHNKLEESLRQIATALKIGETDFVSRALIGIGLATLRGLEPLEERIASALRRAGEFPKDLERAAAIPETLATRYRKTPSGLEIPVTLNLRALHHRPPRVEGEFTYIDGDPYPNPSKS